MNRLSVALLLVIALVAGVAGGTMFGRPEFPAVSSGLTGESETAFAFYDAFDRALAGESADALGALLAPGFLDHDTALAKEQNADEFLARIRSLGASGEAGRLTVESVYMSGNNLIAQVRYESTGSRAFAGVSIEQPASEPVVEVLRTARGRIVERWTPGHWSLHATDPGDEAKIGAVPAGYISTLVRVSIPAEVEEHHWYAPGPGFLVIESGTARLQIKHLIGDDTVRSLERGASVALKARDHAYLRSANDEPVTALIYALVRRAASDVVLAASAADAQAQGVSQSILWNASMAQTGERNVHRLGTLALPASKDLRLTGTANVTLLVSVDSGKVEIGAPGGSVHILGEDYWPVEQLNFAGIEAPNAASVSGTDSIVLHNVSDRPVAVTVIVVHADARPYSLTQVAPAP